MDTLRARLPVNLCYLGGNWGVLMGTGRFDAEYFAALPHTEDRPASRVLRDIEPDCVPA